MGKSSAPKIKPKETPVLVVEEVTASPETTSEEITEVPGETAVMTPESAPSEETIAATFITADESPAAPEAPAAAPDTPAVVMIDTDEEKRAPERMVKVAVAYKHGCTIGGERYDFVPGKQYNVPENVKEVLKQAGLLSAL